MPRDLADQNECRCVSTLYTPYAMCVLVGQLCYIKNNSIYVNQHVDDQHESSSNYCALFTSPAQTLWQQHCSNQEPTHTSDYATHNSVCFWCDMVVFFCMVSGGSYIK